MVFGFNAPVARPKSVSLTWPVLSTRKFCVTSSEWIIVSGSRSTRDYLGLEITMDVAELVKFVDSSKHLRDVVLGMLLL
jgi:hypothetical protein